MDWKKHKPTLIVGMITAIISGLIGSVITQSFSVYNLTRSIKYQQNHEVLNSTRLGIGFLKQVESELDDNVALMLSHEYKITLALGQPFDQAADMRAFINPTNSADEKSADALMTVQHHLMGMMQKIDKLEAPIDALSTAVWDHGAPDIADIDDELLRELSDYYMLARRVNNTIKAFSDVNPGNACSVEYAEKIKRMAEVHNESVARLKQKSVMELKNKIANEMKRLSELRSRVANQP